MISIQARFGFNVLCVASLILFAPTAFAAACPADVQNDIEIQCSSGDITIAALTATNPDQYCLAGTQISLDLDVEMESGNNAKRPDVAVMFSLDGKSLQTTSANGGAADCSISTLDTQLPIIGNEDMDSCNDMLQGNQGALFSQSVADAILVNCDAAIGGAEVFSMIGWKTGNSGSTCSISNLLDDADGLYGFNDAQCSAGSNIVPLNVIGRLRILKTTAPETESTFGFSSTGGCKLEPLLEDGTCTNVGGDDDGIFVLPGDGGIPQDIYQVLGSPINVTEIGGAEGYGLASIICRNDDNDNVVAATVNDPAGNPNLTIALDGDNPFVTCTFFNSEGGTIEIVKDSVPNGPTDFAFTGTGPDSYDFGGGFSLDDDADGTLSNMAQFIGVPFGTYTVTEAAVAGFELTDLTCVDPDDGSSTDPMTRTATIDVDPGETIVCTFTNTQNGTIELEKQTFPDGGPAIFEFTGNELYGFLGDGNFFSVSVIPGTYTSTEVVPAGWDLASINCDDGISVTPSTGDVPSATVTYNVEPGETVRCVFNNVQRGSIVINKSAQGGDEEFCFALALTGGGPPAEYCATTVSGTAQITINDLPASNEVAQDTYSVTEIVPEGWENTYFTCVGDEGLEDALAIDLDPGETVNCTFENVKNARLTLVKQAIGPSGEFCFDGESPSFAFQNLCLETSGGSAETFWDGLTTTDQGTWQLSEVGPEAPWELVSASCDNGDDPSDIDVGPGDDITCTFVNALPIPVPVNNHWALLLLGLMLLGLAWRFSPALSRK